MRIDTITTSSLLLCLFGSATAFSSIAGGRECHPNILEDQVETKVSGRRAFLLSSSTAACTVAIAAFGTNLQPALADVSDGNALPPGAAEFSRLLRLKSDFAVSLSQYVYQGTF
mmetsp:Transcript_346/g.1014  ORF Transcript_346/g.1014 Transcript_346/m.1014 type:complete len:114 (-) Transcript_346:545-886(-)